jgi:putative hemolysin
LRGETSAHSPEEIKLMATATRRVGLLPQFQEEMIHRAIELNQVTVSEIMTPRGKIFSLPADMPVEAASGRIIEEQHSRIPVYDPALGREHIIGIVHSKDVSRLMHFRALSSTAVPGSMTLRQVMREALVAPETKPAVEMLEEFKERHRLMAIVVDEFGSTLGLVTAEDVLEQIVGELEDEFDVGRHLSPLAAGESMVLEGSVSLRDLVTQLRWKLPREAGVETLAGLVLWKLGHIPAVDEAVVVTGKRFTVVEMEGNRVARVRVEALAQRELHLRVAADEVRAEEVS